MLENASSCRRRVDNGAQADKAQVAAAFDELLAELRARCGKRD